MLSLAMASSSVARLSDTELDKVTGAGAWEMCRWCYRFAGSEGPVFARVFEPCVPEDLACYRDPSPGGPGTRTDRVTALREACRAAFAAHTAVQVMREARSEAVRCGMEGPYTFWDICKQQDKAYRMVDALPRFALLPFRGYVCPGNSHNWA